MYYFTQKKSFYIISVFNYIPIYPNKVRFTQDREDADLDKSCPLYMIACKLHCT